MSTPALRHIPLRQHGLSLVELVISIAVIAIAATGALMAMTQATRSSADAVISQQSVAIAEAYLEEIMAQAFADPDGGETGGAEAGETRPTYDDVSDYHNLNDAGARDQNNNAIAGLGGYTVNVTVTNAGLSGVGGADSKLVNVVVTSPVGGAISLNSYRLNF